MEYIQKPFIYIDGACRQYVVGILMRIMVWGKIIVLWWVLIFILKILPK